MSHVIAETAAPVPSDEAGAVGGGKVAIGTMLRRSLQSYVMIFALLLIVVVFWVWSGGTFVSPLNLTNLINQTATVGVMAAGMTLVIIIRHIDLSVGYMSGFMGAVAAILMMSYGIPSPIVIILVLAFGGVIGLGVGLLIGRVGIPAFVITLGMMIVGHGVELLATKKNGTIIITDGFFNALSNGFIPARLWPGGPDRITLFGLSMCLTTVLLTVIGLVVFVAMQIMGQIREQRRHFDVTPLPLFVIRVAFIAVVAGFLLVQLARNNGISWALVILGVVTAIFAVVQTRTRFGRHVYGVGGNPEAAELSGVSVVRVTVIVFVIMGVLMALGGILTASRMKAAYPTAGTGLELLVIAGCFIGGCSPAGGVGKVVGSLVGALIMQALVNGMLLQGVDASMQYVIQGVILVVAVIFDVISRRAGAIPSGPSPTRPRVQQEPVAAVAEA
ncbi:MAG: sugar ABC transporter permease [Actinomycetia bacterium]|nr:sugar ABC transporter permease [Actinomycetes bacterium]